MLDQIKRRVEIGTQSPTWGRDSLADREWLSVQLVEARRLLNLVESAPDEWFREYSAFSSAVDGGSEHGA